MEGITRLVSESLARHGFDRPLDYRRLHWSRWFRCESVRSLLLVPSKPGVFALAEEIMEMGSTTAHVATGASPVPHSEASGITPEAERRMLAVTQFFEDDDMAFVLDRMLSRHNPMRARLVSGRYFVRFVVIDEASQRRSICTALNQWIANSGEKASGIGAHFATSLELTPAKAETITAHVATGASPVPRSEASGSGTEPGSAGPTAIPTAPQLDSGAATNLHCPAPFPSGF